MELRIEHVILGFYRGLQLMHNVCIIYRILNDFLLDLSRNIVKIIYFMSAVVTSNVQRRLAFRLFISRTKKTNV